MQGSCISLEAQVEQTVRESADPEAPRTWKVSLKSGCKYPRWEFYCFDL